MTRSRFSAWRPLFIAGGALVIAGGSQHPRGEHMLAMLTDPVWLQGHAMQFAGFALLAAGLGLYHRGAPAGRTRWWAGAAAVMMMLDALEMGVHTMAYVDAGALPAGAFHAGAATPVLTTHLWLATLIHPVTGAVVIGLILAGMRERALGSRWIGWLGIVGAVAHLAVMPLVFLLRIPEFGILFPMIMFMALWFTLAGLWPVRARQPESVAAAPRPVPAQAVV